MFQDKLEVRTVPRARVRGGRWQPRSHVPVEAIEQLAENIRVHGILEPLLVQRESDGSYTLIAGHRRLMAAERLGMPEVPVRVLTLDNGDALAVALSENLARSDLSAWDEAQALAQLRDRLEATGRRASRARLGELTGRSAGSVSESLTIADRVSQALLDASGVKHESLVRLPKTVLIDAAKLRMPEQRASAIARAIRQRSVGRRERRRKRSDTSSVVGPQEDLLRKGFVLRDDTAAGGGLALEVRFHPRLLPPNVARELLARLRPFLDQMARAASREETGSG